MVQTIKQIGFLEPAYWCHHQRENRSRESIRYYWQEKLGELFIYFRKAT